MNKNELIQLRNGWLQQASRDLSNRLIGFMESNRMNEAELADVLALDVNQIRNMLNGAQNVTLLEFATLLIATGNVLRIEPIAASPFANGGVPRHSSMNHRDNSRNGNRPLPKRDASGRFMPSNGGPARHQTPPRGMMGGMPMPPMDGNMPYPMPPMDGDMSDMFGGMPGIPTPNRGNNAPMGDDAKNFDSMKRSDLANMVRSNHWDNEIDLDEADRSQIIAFLESKNQPQRVVGTEAPQMNGNINEFAQSLLQQLASNPQMLQQLMSTMK